MLITCGVCGLDLENRDGVIEQHYHEPDIFMNVGNCQYSLALARNFETKTEIEILDFNIPEKWADEE